MFAYLATKSLGESLAQLGHRHALDATESKGLVAIIVHGYHRFLNVLRLNNHVLQYPHVLANVCVLLSILFVLFIESVLGKCLRE